MEDVDLRYAKLHLEDLFERARRGEDVRINDAKGRAVQLIPADGQPHKRSRVEFGMCKHLADNPVERMLAPLSDRELAWLSGEKSE